jgi:hypothetical protein
MEAKDIIKEDLCNLWSRIWVQQGNEMGKLTEFIHHNHYTVSVTGARKAINEVH